MDNLRSRFPDDEFLRAASVLDSAAWPTNSDDKILFGDREVALLARTLGMDVSDICFELGFLQNL